MGTCTYTLSKLCESNSSLPYFNVEAANEHRGGNTRVSYVRYVDVDIYGYRINLGQKRAVKVNGVSQVVPVTLVPGVTISLSGQYVVVTTDFGLQVKFDGNHRAEITLPSTYMSKVCGICGNYNGQKADDFLNPDGEMEANSTSLGNSWQVYNDSRCSPDYGHTPNCTDDEKHMIQSNSYCGLITDPSGPFQNCHAVVDPRSYFEDCQYDLCELHLNNAALSLDCPANSHYEPCAAACPATCVDPMAPYNCSLPCVEGCVCDSGYLLYNDRCVPSQQCGCWHNGQHYPVGSEFWTDNTCSSKCTCPAQGSKVQCFNASCPAGQYCGVQNGQPVCLEHSYGICHVHGDPHYQTFDKVTHNFMGNCTYTLAKVCSNTTSLPYFNVEAKNEHRGNPHVSYVREVVVEVYGQRIVILKQQKSHVLVNNVRQTLPVSAAGGAITVSKSGRYIVLETDFSLRVSYDTDHSVEVKVPTTYFNLTCGMCGNFNNRRDDEYMMPNGQQATDSNALGESWQVPDSDPSCGVPEPSPPCSAEEEKLYQSDQFCGILTTRPSSFESCHGVINPQDYFDSCLYDLCALNGGQEFLCAALEAYADACQAAGVTLLPWRNTTFCPVACPPNSHYNPCTSACPATCTDLLASQNCSRPCVEGCECNSGFVLSGGQCVSMSNCGCLQNGKYYEYFESCVYDLCATEGDSDQYCKILEAYAAACEVEGVHLGEWREDTICEGYYIYLQGSKQEPADVARLVSPVCSSEGLHCFRFWYHMYGAAEAMALRVYVVHNETSTLEWKDAGNKGDRWNLGEVTVHSRGNMQIVLEGMIGEDIRSDIALDDLSIVKGQCTGTCVVEGDPHYHTFDNQLHNFMGTCTYTLSKLCESNSSLPYFNVEAANEHRGGNTRVSYVRYVDVDVADQRIRLGQGGVVTVNGVEEILPCSPSAGVQVLSSGFYTMVMTDFGLRVKFDGNHRVEVTLPSTFGQKVCGMCGNYNGIAADDFQNPEGTMEPDSTSLGNSWEVSNNSSCSAGPLPTPACSETDKQLISSSHFCGLLTDTSGPFQVCHAVLSPSSYFDTCSYDLCELGLDRETLCKSLQSYADACQSLGVQIPVWRNSTFCPITCPANSHYEPCAAACPATCVDPMAPVTCSLPCVEGCVCDSGYLLYNDRCVPSQQCGCWHNGQHYPVGSEFWTDNTCSSKCTCPARGSKVQCFNASCPAGQYCGVQNGQPVCLEHSYGICHVHGDPHYQTFDKVTHNFMGNCTYTLAKVCSNTTSLPYFNVEAKNEHRGNPHVSYVREVVVEVYGQRIVILKQQKSHVLVNNVRQTLPVSAAGGAITVSKSGRYIVLETDFSLRVSYDTDHSVEVKVPTTYFNLTCGMCGNFNNRRDDEYMMPNGQQAADSNALGESWQVPDSDPSCGVPEPSPPCSAEEEKRYQSDQFCGILTTRPSSFESCHGVINPQDYFDTCLYDLCALNGGQEFLCAALEAYADACQAAGVTLLPWRNATFCPLQCPPNSYYDPCMTGCPATCVDQHAPQNCSKPCMEGCACSSGFLLSGDTCVPEANCGCHFEGNYYTEGESYVTENCTRQCRCEAKGQMVCSALSCGEDEVCKIQDGQRGCYPASTAVCHIYGDPHYSTFDGKLHHFQGSCNYTVVTGCDNSSVGFSVTTRNKHRGSQSWTALNSVALSLEGLHIALREHKAVYINGALVSLPASPAPGVTISLSGSYVRVSTKLGLQLQFNGDHELLVKVSEKYKGKLCGLCGTYTGSQQDDFMRPDGVVVPDFNDFGTSWMVPDDEWPCDPAISPPASCSPAEEEAANQQCSILTHLGGPFQPCHAVLPPKTYFESCVYDQCATGGSTEQLCNDLGAYAAACAEAGVDLGDWSAGTVCGTTTPPPHTTTSPLPGTSTAPPTDCNFACTFDEDFCGWVQADYSSIDWIRNKGPTPTPNTGPSSDHTTGDGYYIFLRGSADTLPGFVAILVSPECSWEGTLCFRFWYHMYGTAQTMALRVYVQKGDEQMMVWKEVGNHGDRSINTNTHGPLAKYHNTACTHLLTRKPHTQLRSTSYYIPYSAPKHYNTINTKTNNYTWNDLRSTSYYTLYSAAKRYNTINTKTNNYTWNDLRSTSYYNPYSAAKHYNTINTKTNNYTRNDLRSTSYYTPYSAAKRYNTINTKTNNYTWNDLSECTSLSTGTCVVEGDPHYHTFDNQLHNFMGTCTYTLSKLCESNSSLPYFNVEAANEHRGGNTRVSYVRYVDVDVADQRIRLGQGGVVTVNGVEEILPCSPSAGVQVLSSGFYTMVMTDFGLRVKFDGNHRVEVTLPSTFGQKVCGMCGNYNGIAADDFQNPEGTMEPDSTSLGNSWEVSNNSSCSAGPLPTPACSETDKQLISSSHFCGLLTDTSGPFQVCHAVLSPSSYFDTCSYDLCELGLDHETLCKSLQSYADACQSLGVQIPVWRNSTFCPITCPANSHYEPCAAACPATCVDPMAPVTCSLPCVEGCVCDSGYLLYNDRCVPSQQCGCWHNGQHYPVGSEFWTDNTCSSKCTCPAQGSKVQCFNASCPAGQYCGVQNGQPVCLEHSYGICHVHGDPHYQTFDKVTHNFMGNCTYTLAKVCSNTTSLPYFNVEAKNEHRGNPHVSYVREVVVEVYGQRIVILKQQKSHVLVNNVRQTLPVSAAGGAITVSKSGRYIVLETDFSLRVSYDTDHSVEVKVPTTYFNLTCGMCGNFNNRRDDEYMMPNGQQATDSNALGESWQVPDSDPSCGVPEPSPPCSAEEEKLYQSDQFCGILTTRPSSFESCHGVINPQDYFDTCLYDLCALNGGQEFLCAALEAYADACQAAGVTLLPWRNATFCPLQCPPNSYYDPCMTGCPATCVDQHAPQNCSKPCMEGCACSSGFLLSGDTCVPEANCGCHFEGNYYTEGESYVTENCTRQCRCEAKGQMVCSALSCGEDEVCKIQDGQRGCYPASMAVCHIYGDPHYSTFDGKLHHFQGSCNYTVVTGCDNSSVGFSVTTRNKHRGSQSWTALNSVALSLEGLHIALREHKAVYINGALVSLPASPAPGVTISLSGSYVRVSTKLGLQLQFNGDHELLVKVSEKYKGTLCGLCGTYTGSQQDDFMRPDGVVVPDFNDFGTSWMVPDDEWPCDPAISPPASCSPAEEEAANQQCSILTHLGGPFQPCHAVLPPKTYFESCVYDQCATGGSTEQLCNDLGAYAAACAEAGVDLGDWSAGTVCAPPTDCNFACTFDEDFCGWVQADYSSIDWIRNKGPTPTPNTGPSSDHTTGDGYYIFLRGSADTLPGFVAILVSPECSWEGTLCFRFWYHMYGTAQTMALRVYVQKGDEQVMVWKEVGNHGDRSINTNTHGPLAKYHNTACTHLLTRKPHTQLRSTSYYTPYSAAKHYNTINTKTNNYTWNNLSSTSYYTLYSAAKRYNTINTKTNNYTWNDLRSTSYYNPYSAAKHYNTINTKTNNYTWNDLRSTSYYTPYSAAKHYNTINTKTNNYTWNDLSECTSLSTGTCVVEGDPHYHTFDNQLHNFMGTCTYTLSKLCESNSSLPYFNVEAANEHRGGNTRVSYVRYVDVDVADQRIRLGQGGVVTVNGVEEILPCSPSAGVQVLSSGFYTMVMTDFGLRVKFDGNHRVEVTLPSTFGQKVCGMCGNYNGIAADDFQNPEGTMEPDSTSLGNSWEVSNNSSCSAGPLPTPACSETDKQLISSSHFCGLLTDTSGPFQVCHAVLSPSSYFDTCSYDLCELGLDHETLCKSLQSYADACQSLGVQIPVWRNSTFCPITCPANSHYEPCAAACPATCVDPTAPDNCSLPCVEGCVCDSGYLLYNDRCVPSQQCGCWHNGQHYPVGSEFWTDNTCSSKCTCPAQGSKVQCFNASCPAGQYCGVQNGQPVCLEHSYGICHVHGDPHYQTFDKVTHNFMGNCTYTLAKVCSNTTSLPYFNVEAKNEHRGNPHVSYVREVVVEVYGQRIVILKQQKSHVLVNNVRQTLPVSAAGGAITVSKSGRYIVLETDFSLRVSYDTDHSVEVKVPTTYFNLTCGMCGNFNNRRDDEYMMPNGQQATDSNALGESWQVPDSDPSCGVPEPSPPCSAEEEKLYQSDQFCGILTTRPSSFESCHGVINPQDYFDTCLYDLCALNGGQEFLCAALEAYADACQAAGVTLLPWRNATFCPLQCPPNSYYDPCMTGCPATCVDQHAPQNCSKPCMEGCACSSGFLLSGDTCVPEANCGCHFEGNYYTEGESYVTENCTRQCRCEAKGQMVCSALSCGEDEVCKIQDGQRGCYPASTAVCHIYGDPHYSTFDGKLHHFQGSCNYTVVTGCDNSSVGFSVTTRNKHRGSQSWTALNSVALSLEGLHIALREHKAVYINGALVSLPASPAPGVTISLSGSYVRVSTKLGLQLQFNGDHELLVKVSEKYKGKLCGLCGTYTGSQQDDFMRPDGVVVPDFNDFGTSWMVPDDEWPCDPAISPPASCSPAEEEAANQQCSILTHLGGPFQPCHAVLPPKTYFESCVYDLCATGGSTEQLCNDLGAYAAACAEAGVDLGDWSAGTVCGPSTPTPTVPSPSTTTQPVLTSSPASPTPSSGRASCSASGDPHYNTFDHKVHNFMGNCTYTLSKVCTASDSLPYFDVSTTNEHRGANTKVSYVKSVHVEVYGNQISLLKNKKVNVNGHRMNLPVFIEKKISIQSSGGYVLLETDFGLWVRYDGNHYAEVSVPSNYSGLLCGLCGNYNGDPNDDNIKSNGDIASDSTDLGESWLVPENNTICSNGGKEEQCDPVLESEAKKNTACGMITDPIGIFKDCHSKVPPQNFFENCVYDMCFTGGQATSLCYGLQAYAESCVNAGICIEWRNATLCPMSCPGGSIYKSCGSRCPSTCLNISPVDSCSSLPVEGCFCKEGYVLSGDKCVPESNCGCVDEKNQYHQVVNTATNVIPITILGKNEDRGLRGATYLKEVYIDVYGVRITLQKNQGILLNNERVYTPVQNRLQGVSIGNVGRFIVVETDFGLIVKYDGNHHLEITLPRSYFSQVHGMCGNFNDNHEDDLSLTNGTAVTAPQFGNSWEVEEDSDKGCLPDLREDDEPPCTAENKQVIERQCNVLKSAKFEVCHSLVNPDDFIEICIYDMCQYDGMKSALCDIVQAYVDTCKNHGITIKWRNSTFCPLPCPSRSHYKDCVSPCPSTCSDIFASSLCEKTEECTEGCECDDNYVLSNGNCVPLSSCGCRDDDNNYYSAGETWLTPHCTKRCQCQKNGVISCRSYSCDSRETCVIKDGKHKCNPTGFGKCQVMGDPHYITFDGLVHHFQGKYTYILAQSIPDLPDTLTQFSIEGVNYPLRGIRRITYLKEMLISVYNHTVRFRQNKQVLLDGVRVWPPVRPHEGIRIYQRTTRIYLETDFGLYVSYDGSENADIKLATTYRSRVEGLCGDFDGIYRNDFKNPDGVWVRNVNVFGESWKVPLKRSSRLRRDVNSENESEEEPDPGLFQGCNENQLEQQNTTSKCQILTYLNGPFAKCHSAVQPDFYFTSCLFDMCVEGDEVAILCRSLEEYVLACQQQGVSMDDWRQQTDCGMSCPPNSKYNSCMSACPASCNDLTSPSECESPCVEGCECLPGYVLSGFDCVPYKECGCTYLNKYYQIGEIFTTDDCSQKCQCTESSTVFCSDEVCGSGEICGISNYSRGCYRSGPCMPNPCKNDGICSETSNSTSLHFCECSELYTGQNCEAEKIAEDPATEDSDYTIAIVIGVVAGVAVIVILISSTVCLFGRKRKTDTVVITRDSSLKGSRNKLDARVREQDYGCIVNSAFDQNESSNTHL
ncbi:IgGFc-binding protein-like [Haemorhous mexicanus]|uniref:IgGFc-binding protein-like n=1 Tax=Haemorhous mexicanus TaxID=30427 RepID=UPI0028BE7404|nr:IgGFc-binding protein-like [Haemorhous mexicanus]